MGFRPLPHVDHDVITPEFSQRAQGAVLGSAAGDALGAPFEFGGPGLYSRAFPQPVAGGIGEMRGGGVWEPAEFTDDTQMALVQAHSLLERGGLDGLTCSAGSAPGRAARRTWASRPAGC